MDPFILQKGLATVTRHRSVRIALLAVIGIAGFLSIVATAPPVIDVPASELDVKVLIIEDSQVFDQNTKTLVPMGTAAIVVQFYRNGKGVYVADATKITCNDVELKKDALGYSGRVKIPSVWFAEFDSDKYKIHHFREGDGHRAYVMIPATFEKIQEPKVGSSVPRSHSVSILYTKRTAANVRGTADGLHGGSKVGIVGDPQPDTGTYTGLDVMQANNAFEPGPGTIGISKTYKNSYSSASGFKSVKETEYQTSTKHMINWL